MVELLLEKKLSRPSLMTRSDSGNHSKLDTQHGLVVTPCFYKISKTVGINILQHIDAYEATFMQCGKEACVGSMMVSAFISEQFFACGAKSPS